MKLTEEEQKSIVYDQEDVLHFQYVDSQELYEDSNGATITLYILRDKETLKLYGFLHRQRSEELFFEYLNQDLFEVKSKKIMITKYVRKDGKPL